MREQSLKFSVVINEPQGGKLGTGFLVHETGLLATCWHVVRDAFPDQHEYLGLKLAFAPLEEAPNATSTPPNMASVYAFDEATDAALLKIEGSIPNWLTPIPLINSRAAAGRPFSIYAFAEVPDENAVYQTFAASGHVTDTILRNGVHVLQLSSKELFRGMSGGAVYSPSWNGVIGMQSKRLLIDVKVEAFGKEIGFACPAEAIAALAPDVLQPLDPPDVATFSVSAAFTSSVTVVNNIDAAGLKPQWVRPNEFDSLQRWRGAVIRRKHLDAIYQRIGSAREGVHALALWGMHGIGKTTLVSLYVSEHGGEYEYPGGVLWVDCGVNFQPERDASSVIERWADFAYGNLSRLRQFAQLQRLEYLPLQIRSLLSDRGKMLIVFDDVTHAAQLDPFLEIVPNSANLLLTTSDRDLIRKIRFPFEEYEIGSMSHDEAQQLVWQKLPELAPADVQKIVVRFEYHPQAINLIASDIAAYSDTQSALQRVLNESALQAGGLTPIWSAYTLALNSLPTDRDRERISLLSVLNEYGTDFSEEIAAAVWGEPVESARSALHLYRQRALLTLNERQRWSMHVLLRQHVVTLLTDANVYAEALDRYTNHIFFKAADSAQWTSIQPDLAHFRAVISGAVEEVIAWFHLDLDSIEFHAINVNPLTAYQYDWLNRLTNALFASFTFLLLRPEMYLLGKRWIVVYLAACYLLDYPEATGWGWFVLARWFVLGEDIEGSLHAYEMALEVGEETGSLSLIGYATLAQTQLVHRSGRTRDAIDSLRTLYQRLIDEYSKPDPSLEVSLLINLSSMYLSNFTYDKARQYLEQARSRLENMPPDPYLTLQVTRQLGLLYVQQQQIAEGLSLLDHAKQMSDSLDDTRASVEIVVNIAYAYYQQGGHETAETHLDKAEQIIAEIRYHRLRSAILLYRAAIRFAQGKLGAAMEVLAETQASLIEFPDKNIEAQSFALLGEIHIRQGQLDEALRCLKAALPLMRDLENTSTGVMILNAIGGIFEQTNRIEEGLQFFHEWLPVIQDLNNSGAQVTILNWLAILLSRVGNVGQAMQYFDTALQIADKLENASERATAMTMTGMLYRFGGELDKAQTCLQKVAADWRLVGNLVKLRETLLQLASVEMLRGNLQQAEYHLEEVQTLVDETVESVIVRSAMLNLRGVISLRLEAYDTAKPYFEEAQRFAQSVDVPSLHIDILNNLAYLALFQQDIDEAISYLDAALDAARTIDFGPQTALVLSNLGWMRLIQGKTNVAADLFEEAAQTLEKAGLIADTGNQSVEQLRGFAELARSQGVADTPLDTLRLLLEAVSWEAVSFIIRVRHEALFLEEMQDVLGRTLAGARFAGQGLAARVLDNLRRVIEDCRREGFGVLQNMGRDYANADMERWWAGQLRASGNYPAARAIYNKLLERNPGDVEALIERGWTYRGLGQISAAIEDFEQAAKVSLSDYRPHQGLGVIYYDLDKLDRALGHLTKAVLQMPADTYNYQWRGGVYQALSDLVSAEADLKEAVSRSPEAPAHRYWYGLLKLQDCKFGDAVKLFASLIEEERGKNHLLVFNYFWRAVAAALFGDQRTAKLDWERGYQLTRTIHDTWALPLYQLVYLREDDRARQSALHLLDRPNMWHPARQFRRHLHMLGHIYSTEVQIADFKLWFDEQLTATGTVKIAHLT